MTCCPFDIKQLPWSMLIFSQVNPGQLPLPMQVLLQMLSLTFIHTGVGTSELNRMVVLIFQSCRNLPRQPMIPANKSPVLGSIYPEGCPHCRLIHSPSLLAMGLSVGYETWPAIGWCHCLHAKLVCLNMDWVYLQVKCIIGKLQCIVGWCCRGGIHTDFQRSLTIPYTALTAGKLPAISAVQGDCERVYVPLRIAIKGNRNAKYRLDVPAIILQFHLTFFTICILLFKLLKLLVSLT